MISSLTRQAARELFYHGTSIANLKSILSEGLTSGHTKVWETDTDERSRASFGGTYFTKNFMTATSSAGRANEAFTGNYGDDRVVVVARLETRTPDIRIDEDELPDPGSAIAAALGLIMNAYAYMHLASDGYREMDRIAEKFMSQVAYRWKIDRRMAEHLKQYVPDMIKAYAEREIAIGLSESDWSRVRYSEEFPDFKDFTVADKEAKWRQASGRFMTKAHRLTGAEGGGSLGDNVRTDETVAFRGANRIVLVARMTASEDPKYYLKVRIAYGNDTDAISMLLGDITTRLGDNVVVQDVSGNVIYDKPKEEDGARAASLTNMLS